MNGVQCPFPGCGHVGYIVTKVHCRTVHNMEQSEVFSKYGKPQYVSTDPTKLKKNQQITNAEVGRYSKYNNDRRRKNK